MQVDSADMNKSVNQFTYTEAGLCVCQALFPPALTRVQVCLYEPRDV